jgi:hypothetical protein
MLAFKLSSCHSSISSLKSLNDDLNARIEKLNVASSFVSMFQSVLNAKTMILMLVVIMLLLLQN